MNQDGLTALFNARSESLETGGTPRVSASKYDLEAFLEEVDYFEYEMDDVRNVCVVQGPDELTDEQWEIEISIY